MSEEVVVSVNNVSKDFILPHEKANSIKSLFTGAVKRHNVQKGKETQHALRDISFEIKKGEFFGIVGRNGSGKSTLLKILAGIYQPTSGKVHTKGKLVPFIELGVGFNPELTGRENVYLNGAMLGFSEKEVSAMYKEIVDFAELERFMDQKLKNYSSGMQVRLAFSMAVRAEADILLIDEVLAVGDADFQRKCYDYFKKLKKDKKTVVFVSHDMEAVREYCDRAMLIEESRIINSGPADRVAEYYKQLFSTEEGQVHDNQENQQRWGSNLASVASISVEVNKDYITINETIAAHKAIDSCVAGFRIKSATGEHITGTNSVLENHKLGKKKAGEKYILQWKFPNILSEGRYYVDPTVHSSDTSQVYDWWEDAVKFSVRKNRKLPFYAVDPSFTLVERKVTK